MRKNVMILVILSAVIFIPFYVHAEAPDLTAYILQDDVFREFIQNPSAYELESKANKKQVYQFHSNIPAYTQELLGLDTSNDIVVTVCSNGEENTYITKQGSERLGNLPVFDTLADYLGNSENIQILLQENDVDEPVSKYALFEVMAPVEFHIPPILWVKTENSDYFVQIGMEKDGYYSYILNTYQDFLDRFMFKNGILMVNDRSIDTDYLLFSNAGALVPFRAAMEALGNEIIWNGDDYSITIKTKDEEYLWKLSNPTTVYLEINGEEIPIMRNEWFNFSYDIIDGITVVGNNTIKGFLEISNADIDLDLENRIVNICQTDYSSSVAD